MGLKSGYLKTDIWGNLGPSRHEWGSGASSRAAKVEFLAFRFDALAISTCLGGKGDAHVNMGKEPLLYPIFGRYLKPVQHEWGSEQSLTAAKMKFLAFCSDASGRSTCPREKIIPTSTQANKRLLEPTFEYPAMASSGNMGYGSTGAKVCFSAVCFGPWGSKAQLTWANNSKVLCFSRSVLNSWTARPAQGQRPDLLEHGYGDRCTRIFQ